MQGWHASKDEELKDSSQTGTGYEDNNESNDSGRFRRKVHKGRSRYR
jgi:hypothetical protein